MARLIEKPPVGGLPVAAGGVTLSLCDKGCLTSLAPYEGGEAALDAALKAAHGVAYPRAGEVSTAGDAACIWWGRGQAMLAGPAPDPGLAAHAALTDQSDGWAAFALEGALAAEMLARLTPIDLRESAFGAGQTARSLLGHMNAAITCLGTGRYEIMVFRSMARSALHELTRAMKSVAAQVG